MTAVPARHFSSRSPFDRDRTLWCGYVVTGPSGSVYFAGDTGWGSHFRMIGERFPDLRLALLPIGAYRPRWFMAQAHIDPEDAIRAQEVLGAKTAIAIHFGTFAQADDGEFEPVEELKAALARHPDSQAALSRCSTMASPSSSLSLRERGGVRALVKENSRRKSGGPELQGFFESAFGRNCLRTFATTPTLRSATSEI